MLSFEDFSEIASIQSTIFTPGFSFNSSLVLRRLLEIESDLFDGAPTVLPIPEDAPREIPRITLQSSNRSFKIDCTGSTGPAARWCHVDIPVTVGKKYVSRFWVRANGDANGEIHLWVQGLHNPVAWVDSDDKWVRLVGSEITATGPTISMHLNSSGSGTVYFDDIFIAELPD